MGGGEGGEQGGEEGRGGGEGEEGKGGDAHQLRLALDLHLALVRGELLLLRHHLLGERARQLGLRLLGRLHLGVLVHLLLEHRVEPLDVLRLLLLDRRRQDRAPVLVELVELVVRLLHHRRAQPLHLERLVVLEPPLLLHHRRLGRRELLLAHAEGVQLGDLLVEHRLLLLVHLLAQRLLALLAPQLRQPVLLPHRVEDAVLLLLHLELLHLLAELVRARGVRGAHDGLRLLLSERVAREAPLALVRRLHKRLPLRLALAAQLLGAGLHLRFPLLGVHVERCQRGLLLHLLHVEHLGEPVASRVERRPVRRPDRVEPLVHLLVLDKPARLDLPLGVGARNEVALDQPVIELLVVLLLPPLEDQVVCGHRHGCLHRRAFATAGPAAQGA